MWDPDTLRAKNDARAEQLRALKAERLRLKEWLRHRRNSEYLAHKLSLGCASSED